MKSSENNSSAPPDATPSIWWTLHRCESGQGMTEYILLVVFVAIAVLIVLGAFGKRIKEMFRESNAELQGIQIAPLP